ncbi:MAG: Sapep family Mn(2+)-dependent dipeptidase [Oscillospiraceae bacterium]|nr:Sapep family Mn(2+)-dependent dipeptidase [Oscillospiraceae bacterium]
MQYKDQIRAWLLAHEEAMRDDLSELVAIPSVKGTPAAGAPFGEKPLEALHLMLEKCQNYGFSTDNADNYAGCVSYGKDAKLGILAHLDVVPAGEGWIHEPFAMTYDAETDKYIGRGTSDDKGPAIAALYAMRAVKELGIPLKHGVQLILGTDEENGSDDLAYYMRHRELPPMVFTPDGDYPVINLEKGMARVEFHAEFSDGKSQILHLSAGEAVNAVPAYAEATVKGVTIDEFLASRQKEYAGTGIGCSVDENDLLTIRVDGRNAHASTPETGRNALTCLLEILCPILNDGKQAEAVRALSKAFPFGETDGTSCGVKIADDISGALTLVLSVMRMDEGKLTADCDTRFPVCASGTNVITQIGASVRPLAYNVLMCDDPHYTDEKSPFVQTLLRVYEDVTGEQGKCLAIGGGTYVHHIEGGVAFGATFPGVDVHMHGAEEFIQREHLLLDAQMMALAITELCG